MSTAIFGFTVILFTFGGLPISSLGFAALFSFGCQAAMITAVTMSSPASPTEIKN
jgi:hypothetical protein